VTGPFIHHSWHPLVFNREHVYTNDQPHGHGKPVGLWFSPEGEDDWARWCLRESNLGPWRYRVSLDPNAHILWISTADQLIAFHDIYCAETEFERKFMFNDDRRKYWPIDWDKVKADYDGLIIAPYLWSQRLMGPSWYYGWDCASGCVWNAKSVLFVEPAPLLALKPGEGIETPIGSP
jgi:hypothetical protein